MRQVNASHELYRWTLVWKNDKKMKKITRKWKKIFWKIARNVFKSENCWTTLFLKLPDAYSYRENNLRAKNLLKFSTTTAQLITRFFSRWPTPFYNRPYRTRPVCSRQHQSQSCKGCFRKNVTKRAEKSWNKGKMIKIGLFNPKRPKITCFSPKTTSMTVVYPKIRHFKKNTL